MLARSACTATIATHACIADLAFRGCLRPRRVVMAAMGDWIGHTVTSDLGSSTPTPNQSVSTVLAERGPWTLLLSGTALAAAIAIRWAPGCGRACTPGGRLDRAIAASTTVVQAVPPFELSLGAVTVFAVSLQWFPVVGLTDRGANPTVGQGAWHLVLPTAVLTIPLLPWLVHALLQSAQCYLIRCCLRRSRPRSARTGRRRLSSSPRRARALPHLLLGIVVALHPRQHGRDCRVDRPDPLDVGRAHRPPRAWPPSLRPRAVPPLTSRPRYREVLQCRGHRTYTSPRPGSASTVLWPTAHAQVAGAWTHPPERRTTRFPFAGTPFCDAIPTHARIDCPVTRPAIPNHWSCSVS